MGFLFDDDLFADREDGSREASSCWAELVAGGDEPLAVPEGRVALHPCDAHAVLTKFREPSGWLSAGIEAH
jgi:hypothetical protein